MKATPEHDERVANLKFGSVYPHYVSKMEKKGRTEKELLEVMQWLTGYDESRIREHIAAKTTMKAFFEQAELNPNAHQIKGVICGYRIEELENPITRQARYMDKLVDELARGRKVERILRE